MASEGLIVLWVLRSGKVRFSPSVESCGTDCRHVPTSITTCLYRYVLLDVVLAAEVLHALWVDLEECCRRGFFAPCAAQCGA